MIDKKLFYNLKCDCCGQLIDEQYWDEEEGATAFIDEFGWKATEDGKHYCLDCFEHDENDRLVTKDGHVYDGNGYPLSNEGRESLIRHINRTSPRDGVCAYEWCNSAEETPNEGETVHIRIITTSNEYFHEAIFKTNVPTGEQGFFWDGGFCKVSNNLMWRRLENDEE